MKDIKEKSNEYIHEKCCSNKNCTCGGHNANNPKKNLNHHGTKSKLSIRKNRKFMDFIKGE